MLTLLFFQPFSVPDMADVCEMVITVNECNKKCCDSEFH
jgi:hypothetical protein